MLDLGDEVHCVQRLVEEGTLHHSRDQVWRGLSGLSWLVVLVHVHCILVGCASVHCILVGCASVHCILVGCASVHCILVGCASVHCILVGCASTCTLYPGWLC